MVQCLAFQRLIALKKLKQHLGDTGCWGRSPLPHPQHVGDCYVGLRCWRQFFFFIPKAPGLQQFQIDSASGQPMTPLQHPKEGLLESSFKLYQSLCKADMDNDNPPPPPLSITSHSVLRHGHRSCSRLSPLTSGYAGGCYSVASFSLHI